VTDEEKTRLCAEAMEVQNKYPWNPLHDDAQAMALDSVLLNERRAIVLHDDYFYVTDTRTDALLYEFRGDMTKPENRRRARVECVAKMWKERSK